MNTKSLGKKYPLKMRRIKSNQNQIARLVSLMEANPDIAKGLCSKAGCEKRWEKFTAELNSLGPPVRNTRTWQRVWKDLKCKTKKKNSEDRRELCTTGGGPCNLNTLNETEETVTALLNMTALTEAPGNEFGTQGGNQVDSKTDTVPGTSHQLHVPSTAKRKRAPSTPTNERLDLLKKQTKAQQKYYESVTKHLQNIECYTKKNYQVQKEMLEVQKEKVKLLKYEMTAKAEARDAKLQLKKQLMDLKKHMYSHL